MNLETRGIVNYLLLPVSSVFFILSGLRRWFYRLGIFNTQSFKTPVIVVGNITVGGSGKTPVVIALANYFKRQGKRVGVVSRGYGGQHAQGSLSVDKHTQAAVSGDEPLLIAIQTEVPVMINKDRAQAVKDLIDQYQPELILSDDGLQHYAMGRKIEIAVIDGLRRFGNGFFLPAGPLRESRARLNKVDFVINNGALCAGEFSSELTPKVFVNVKTGEQKPLDYFQGELCHGVAGIGHPQRFFNTLIKLGVELEAHEFKDHYAYQSQDLSFADNHPILMTAKDCVKCSQFATENMWYLQVEANLSKDFLTKLDAKL